MKIQNQDMELLAEEAFLRGPDDLLVDFDRAVKVFNEFVSGCRSLYVIGLAVTVFGSARFKEDHRYYQIARELGQQLAGKGFVVESMHREGTVQPGEVEVKISNSPTETTDYIRDKIRQAQT